ncbi:hypothetical protein TBS_32760 [Thermobispora bispora]|jgi:hypothetical protein|uniref:Uncharacterized protein n=1 Tax=Thermobispora bispora (strain ATCC 19993 / DSM 43833 / CBS 139.67 / JCM 10125 / KCTC 9307 / NBRC 14880 / R51) TaxID=469371 RepID=D6Y8V4_THEBD|nr:hypothetical protein [Thermobispora bispora]MBO2474856.1 hypothetical protein [Actinomycetales bacterium]MDI9582317.1 hypothetical protein [Thermobispora sp.]ADG89916.1 hypothetical protein Tbis_3226 [Thermobispora bispora DSM 43833]MBX6168445.1 hypothetical protein [Thermobispora bispora]QSI49491.1 hypothetical protein CYL17_17865 [Thermobispora bispora]
MGRDGEGGAPRRDREDRRPRPARDPGDLDRTVDTVVVPDKGRWAVDLIVMSRESVVRHRISVHPTKERAEISARIIKRTADRDLGGR